MKQPTITNLIGKTMTAVATDGDAALIFTCEEGEFIFNHHQDCCESVFIESITGDLRDLVGYPILVAEEGTSGDTPEGYTHKYEPDSQTWTFYKFATIKGYVDVRWFGESNGYYSESVDLTFTPAAT